MEKWITIQNYGGYEVSNLGQIRSINYKRTGTIRILKPTLNPQGYLCTMIKNDNGFNKKFFTCSYFMDGNITLLSNNEITS